MGSLVLKCMGFLGSFRGFCRSWLHSWVGPLRKVGFAKASDLYSFSNACFGMKVSLASNVVARFVLVLIPIWLFVFGNLFLSLHACGLV